MERDVSLPKEGLLANTSSAVSFLVMIKPPVTAGGSLDWLVGMVSAAERLRFPGL
jgi:hypothetical protein